jgi:hypothetical protein
LVFSLSGERPENEKQQPFGHNLNNYLLAPFITRDCKKLARSACSSAFVGLSPTNAKNNRFALSATLR